MRISGVTIIRNIEKFKYPAVESIKSILPICDEFIVNVGNSEDNTKQKIELISSDKIRIIETIWDETNRKGGSELSKQTNIALRECKGDWIFYIQADEVFPEWELSKVTNIITKANKNSLIEAIAFEYLHFYGSYFTVQHARNWYKYEVRLFRNNIGVKSHGDAQGFRINGRKPRAIISGCQMFHYGWARKPEIMKKKILDFHKWWQSEDEIKRKYKYETFADYFHDLGNLEFYNGPHPSVMKELITDEQTTVILELKQNYIKKRSILQYLKDMSRRFGKGHWNFKLVKKW